MNDEDQDGLRIYALLDTVGLRFRKRERGINEMYHLTPDMARRLARDLRRAATKVSNNAVTVEASEVVGPAQRIARPRT